MFLNGFAAMMTAASAAINTVGIVDQMYRGDIISAYISAAFVGISFSLFVCNMICLAKKL